MPKIRNLVFATICASQFGFIEKTRFLLPPRSNQKPGFCHNMCFPVWIYRKNPVSFAPPQQSETGFLSQYVLPSLDLSKKPGFSQQHAKTRFLSPLCRRCVAVRLLVVLPDFWWRHTLLIGCGASL